LNKTTLTEAAGDYIYLSLSKNIERIESISFTLNVNVEEIKEWFKRLGYEIDKFMT
jgi:hypothetical protein